jgi:glycosyltransferase involved in cell wall biosynthesis
LKIVFLIPSLAPGGAERQLATLARELARRGEKVTVVVFRSGGALEAPLRHAGVEILSPDKRGRFDTLGFLARLAGLLRALGPDVLHGYLPTANLAALAMRPFLRGARIVWGVRASDVDHSAYGPLSRAVYGVERMLARLPDLILVNSHRGRERYVSRGFPKSRTVVVENGIDCDYFAPRAEEGRAMRGRWGIGSDEIVVGLAARLDPMKDHETFLRAAALAAKARSDLRFVCVGGGPEAEFARLRALAGSLGVPAVFAGECHDMPAAYSAFDIAACTSTGEGFPNMVAEAMACGVPVAASDVGDCARIVADSGIVMPPRDPQAMAHAWLRLVALTVAERKALGAKARERVAAQFSVASLAEKTLRALRGEGVSP